MDGDYIDKDGVWHIPCDIKDGNVIIPAMTLFYEDGQVKCVPWRGPDPILDAEFILDDILDAEEIG